jgi:hypothetical protein
MAASSQSTACSFTVENNKQHPTARTGILTINNKNPVRTPALLVETFGGSLHGVSVDLVKELNIELALIDLTNLTCLTQLKDPTKLFALPDNTCTIVTSNCLKLVS